MATTAVTTAEELALLPEDGYRYELVRGELRRMTPAGFEHGDVALGIGMCLRRFVEEHDLGRVVGAETGFRLGRDPDTVLAPDAAFVRADRLPPPSERQGFLDVAPDLIVEVVSPTDRAADVAEKALLYLEAGVALVWVLYPAQRLVEVRAPDGTVRILRDHEQLDGAPVLPGFVVAVADLFR